MRWRIGVVAALLVGCSSPAGLPQEAALEPTDTIAAAPHVVLPQQDRDRFVSFEWHEEGCFHDEQFVIRDDCTIGVETWRVALSPDDCAGIVSAIVDRRFLATLADRTQCDFGTDTAHLSIELRDDDVSVDHAIPRFSRYVMCIASPDFRDVIRYAKSLHRRYLIDAR